jgi:TIGR03009 family protein
VRQASSQGKVGPQTAADAEAAALRALGPPAPFTLTPEHEKYLDEILGYWEHRSSEIERYRCKFERWEYDPTVIPRDPEMAYKYSVGVIRYESPDKGEFHVEKVKIYQPPKTAENGKPPEKGKLVDQQGDPSEHWICDGNSVFEYQAAQKKLVQRELPPDMRGRAIVDGPLPFLFGAKADKIKARYWMRVVTPTDAKGEYWLEAWPKSSFDAQNFQRIEIILDEKDYLPKAMKIYNRLYDERSNWTSSVFQFEEREVNWNTFVENLPWSRHFSEPATPRGWKKVVEPYAPAPTLPATPEPRAPAGGTAAKKKTGARR